MSNKSLLTQNSVKEYKRGKSNLLRMYQANYCLFAYPNGNIEFTKNRFGPNGLINKTEDLISMFSDMIAEHKFRRTSNSLFKETAKKQIELSIKKVLEGDFE
jgi:hypothetical protein